MSNSVHEQQDRTVLIDRRWLRLAIVSLLIVLVGGVLSAVTQNSNGMAVSHAMPADMSVVGPPTLTASTINSIFANAGSPMAGTGALIEQTSRATNIDDAFAMGVWWAETNDGMAGVGNSDRNPGSVRGNTGYPVAADGYTLYPNYSAAIVDWFHLIQNGYVGQGLTTVYSISTRYVGTSGAPSWAAKVITYAYRYRGEAPPPPVADPTPIPTPTPVQRRISIPPSDQVHHPQPVEDPGQKNLAPKSPVLHQETWQRSGNPAAAATKSPGLSSAVLRLLVMGGLLLALLIFLFGYLLDRRTKRLSLVQAWTQSRVPFEGLPQAAPLMDGQVPTGTLQSPAFATAEPEAEYALSRSSLGDPSPLPAWVAPEGMLVTRSTSPSSGGLLRKYKFTSTSDTNR